MRVETGQSRSDGVYGMSPRRRTQRASGAKSRAGFTLVELIVAMMVFAIGVLGLAATAASVTRLMGGASRQTIAANIAQSRLEKLRASPCGTLANGADTVRGVVSAWTVQTVTRGVNITETVIFPTQGGNRTRTYKTTLPC
jgi:type IV pilus modification protein PilV